MSDNFETSFCELRRKEVVNSADGKRLGRIIDLIISLDPNVVQGIVVPFGKFNLFSKQQNVFIPFTCINKIGEDIILVDIVSDADGNLLCKTTPEHHEHHHEHPEEPVCDEPNRGRRLPDCDRHCEKCMKFDCEHRWQV